MNVGSGAAHLDTVGTVLAASNGAGFRPAAERYGYVDQ